MPTPTTLAELFDMPKNKITFGGRIFAINSQLKLQPWQPPVCAVWADADPSWLKTEARKSWWQLRTLLGDLHDEHLRRK